MNTGELTEYFDDFDEIDEYEDCETYNVDKKYDYQEMEVDGFDALNKRLDQIIIQLKQQIKEKEVSNKTITKNNIRNTTKIQTSNKTSTNNNIQFKTPTPITKQKTTPNKKSNNIRGWKIAIIYIIIVSIIFCIYLIYTS